MQFFRMNNAENQLHLKREIISGCIFIYGSTYYITMWKYTRNANCLL